MLKTLLTVGVVVAIAMLSAGLIWDTTGFAENMLSELAGSLLTVLITVLMVRKLLERDHARQWATVRGSLRATVSWAVDEFIYDVAWYLTHLSVPYSLLEKMDRGPSIHPWSGTTITAVVDFFESNLERFYGVGPSTVPPVVVNEKLGGGALYTEASDGSLLIMLASHEEVERANLERDQLMEDMKSSRNA